MDKTDEEIKELENFRINAQLTDFALSTEIFNRPLYNISWDIHRPVYFYLIDSHGTPALGDY